MNKFQFIHVTSFYPVSVSRAPMVCPCATAVAPSLRSRHDRLFTFRPPPWHGWRAVSARTSSDHGSWPGIRTSLSTQQPSRQSVRSWIITTSFIWFWFYSFFFFFLLHWLWTGALRLPDRPKKPLPLKPVERKPLESVVRYLGEI